MVVKSDGTKWACMSCLKGHRVSGCTHTDRELQLVPKKGRPVTQCQHCRQERKKRSAHVKCDCGETEKPHHSKEKCIHLREAEDKAKYVDEEAIIQQQGCCCHHGGDCNCSAMKKDIKEKPHRGPAVSKPRLESVKSESSLTVFQNGHHKPVHRNHAAHECGMPYKLPVSKHTGDSRAARRSVDSLALDSAMTTHTHTPPTDAPSSRGSTSGHPSPRMLARELSAMEGFNALSEAQTNPTIQSVDNDFYNFNIDTSSVVAESSYDPWSALPTGDSTGMPNNNPFGVWPTNSDMSGAVQPALTAASSGTQSEVDEIPQMDDFYGFNGFGMPSIQEDDGPFSNSSGSTTQQPNRRSLPPNFFSASDVMATNQNGDWQIPVDHNGHEGKSNSVDNGNTPGFEDGWQAPLPLITAMPHRSIPVLANGRPASHYLASGNVPNDDVIQQLFPGIDVNGNLFDLPDVDEIPDLPTGTDKLLGSANGSSPMEYGPTDKEAGFTAQPWTDGSMSVPNDSYTFEFEQDYSTPEFDNNWSR